MSICLKKKHMRFIYPEKKSLKNIFHKNKTMNVIIDVEYRINYLTSQPATTCSKLIIETLEQGVKYVQN